MGLHGLLQGWFHLFIPPRETFVLKRPVTNSSLCIVVGKNKANKTRGFETCYFSCFIPLSKCNASLNIRVRCPVHATVTRWLWMSTASVLFCGVLAVQFLNIEMSKGKVSFNQTLSNEFPLTKAVDTDHVACVHCYSSFRVCHGWGSNISDRVQTKKHKTDIIALNVFQFSSKWTWIECGDEYLYNRMLILTYGAEPFLRSCQLCSHSGNSQQF
jgi:hypothetical protein